MVIKKVRRFLEDNGIAEKFSYIKSLDTIELSGTANNGGERVLFNDVIREYGEGAVFECEGGKCLLPCIPEGVIKSRTKDNVIYYSHFIVTDSSEQNYDLELKEYHFSEGDFYLRYLIKIKGINHIVNQNRDDEDSGEIEVESSCVQQFLLDSFSKDELKRVFNKQEMSWLIETAKKDDDNLIDRKRLIFDRFDS